MVRRCLGCPSSPCCSPATRLPEPEAAVGWLADLTAALQIPGLGAYGLTDADTGEVVAATQRASSMTGNPIDLTDDEVAEVFHRSRR